MTELTTETIEQIRMLKGRNVPVSKIAESIGLPIKVVENMLFNISSEINPKAELLSAVDSYSTMILDLSSLIADLKKTKNGKCTKRLNDYIKQRTDLQNKKVELLLKVATDKDWNQTHLKPASEISVDSFKPLQIENKESLPKQDLETTIKLRQTEAKAKRSKVKKICKKYCYQVIGQLSTLGYTRKDVVKKGIERKHRKIILNITGCSKEELDIVVSRIKKNKFPKPKDEKENRLYGVWKKHKKQRTRHGKK